MPYKNIVALSLLALIIASSTANAQTTSPERGARPNAVQERRGEARDRMEDRRENALERRGELRDERQERRATATDERRDQRIERQKKNIEAYFERVMKRLDAALNRMTKLGDRVASRIMKLEGERGVNLSDARAKLELARKEIAGGQAAIIEAKGLIASLLASDNPREIFGNVKDIIRKTVESIREAHRALVETLKAAKAASGLRDTPRTDTTTENNQ